MGADGLCCYKLGTKHCAIGFSIPAGHEAMSTGGDVNHLMSLYPGLFPGSLATPLFELQRIHDINEVSTWETKLKEFAERYELSVPVL